MLKIYLLFSVYFYFICRFFYKKIIKTNIQFKRDIQNLDTRYFFKQKSRLFSFF